MTITYPLPAPTSIYPASAILTLSHAQSVSQSPFTKQTQVYDWGSQAWQLDVSLPPLTPDEADDWIAGFALRLRGMFGTFLFGDPARYKPAGVGTGTPLVNGAGQSGFSLLTKGWTHSTAKILKTGDYFQLGTGETSRLYKLTADAVSDSSGNSILEFTPSLRIMPSDGDALTINEPVGVFRMASGSTSWDERSAIEYGFTFTAFEVIDVT